MSTWDKQSLTAAGKTLGGLPRRVLDQLQEGCQVISREFRYLYVNHAVAAQAKTTREALLGRTMMECFPGIQDTAMFSQLRSCMAKGQPATMENEFSYPDGTKGWFDLHLEPLPEGVVILSVDVSDRKRTEIALQRTARALATLGGCNQTLVRAKDEQSFIHDVCHLVVDSGGYAAARIEMHRPHGAAESEERAVVHAKRAGDECAETKSELSLAIQVEDEAVGVLTIGAPEADAFDPEERALLEEIAMDLGYGVETLRTRLAKARTEEQLVASQRLEAVGRLAGGIAHDFNNLLTVIQTYTSFVAEQINDLPNVSDDLEQVLEASKRAATLVRQLLAFSSKQVVEPQVTNCNRIVGNVEGMLRRLLGEDIQIVVQTSSDLGNIMADPGQMEQVLMNLAVNARDAMPQGGKLTIETDNVEFEEGYTDSHFLLKPGRYVRVSVTDSGTGMDQETRQRIFEPFFTTKERDKGTGLGLSMVHGIIKQSGGNIGVYSELGYGTTFKIYLPRVDAAIVSMAPNTVTHHPSGNEVILLVEDEAAVRLVIERILKSAGYLVHCAENAREALRISERLGDEIALLLTDVVMPEMSGPELAERLKQMNPSLKVLFVSGYTDGTIAHHGVLDPGAEFVSKPFSSVELKRKVKETLEAGDRSRKPLAKGEC